MQEDEEDASKTERNRNVGGEDNEAEDYPIHSKGRHQIVRESTDGSQRILAKEEDDISPPKLFQMAKENTMSFGININSSARAMNKERDSVNQ